MSVKLGPYRLARKINNGGQGSVYLGFDTRLKRKVAIKIHHLPSKRSSRKACIREARIVAGVASDRVVQIYDLIESSAHLAIVMEYVHGASVEELLNKTQLSFAAALSLSSDIVAALAVFRQQGIVHGDLKPANVLINSSGRVKLVDFGLSRVQHTVFAKSDLLTSHSALTPEHVQCEPITTQSDLFALGRLMYRLVYGADPFAKASQIHVAQLMGELSLEAPPKYAVAGYMVPQSMKMLLASLLAIDPDLRPGNTHTVRTQLREMSLAQPMSLSETVSDEISAHISPEFTVPSEELVQHLPEDLFRKANTSAVLAQLFRGALAFVFMGVLVFSYWRLGASALPIRLVQVESPVIQLHSNESLPETIDSHWLLARVGAVFEQKRALAVYDAGRASPAEHRLISTGSELKKNEAFDERLEMSLQCKAEICIFNAVRYSAKGNNQEQISLFAFNSVRYWRRGVESALTRLYEGVK